MLYLFCPWQAQVPWDLLAYALQQPAAGAYMQACTDVYALTAHGLCCNPFMWLQAFIMHDP